VCIHHYYSLMPKIAFRRKSQPFNCFLIKNFYDHNVFCLLLCYNFDLNCAALWRGRLIYVGRYIPEYIRYYFFILFLILMIRNKVSYYSLKHDFSKKVLTLHFALQPPLTLPPPSRNVPYNLNDPYLFYVTKSLIYTVGRSV